MAEESAQGKTRGDGDREKIGAEDNCLKAESENADGARMRGRRSVQERWQPRAFDVHMVEGYTRGCSYIWGIVIAEG
eukprot:1360724-Pleurochrysis_carterae.AAC.1